MRPTPIPDEEVWPGAVRRVIAGAGGDLTGDIRPVEALITVDRDHGAMISMRITLDPGDLARLAEHGTFWLTSHGPHLHPFSLHVPGEPDGEAEAQGAAHP